MSGIDERRRLSFGSVAEQYDVARPSYPAELVEDVLAFASHGIGRPPRDAIDVGAGTGIATELFAGRGLRVHAIEPSAAMAAVWRRRIATAGLRAELELCDFEEAELADAAYDLVYSAQAWHWVRPEAGYARARRALVSGGALATFWNRVDWSRCELREVLLAAYDRSGVTFDDPGPMYPTRGVPQDYRLEWLDRIAGAADWGGGDTRRYDWALDQTANVYLAMLATHSDHVVLELAERARLEDELRGAIESHGGRVRLPIATLLCLARAE